MIIVKDGKMYEFERIDEDFVRINGKVIRLFNPFHDKQGRFAPKPSSRGIGPGGLAGYTSTSSALFGFGPRKEPVTPERVAEVKKRAEELKRNVNSHFKGGLIKGGKLTVCGTWECVNESVGAKTRQEKNWVKQALALAHMQTGDITITPKGVQFSGKEMDYILTHEIIHTRKRNTSRQGNSSNLDVIVEEGCTDLMAQGISKYHRQLSGYTQHKAIMASYALQRTKGNVGEAWQLLADTHYKMGDLSGTKEMMDYIKSQGGLYYNPSNIYWMLGSFPDSVKLEEEDLVQEIRNAFIEQEKALNEMRAAKNFKQFDLDEWFHLSVELEEDIFLANPFHDNLGRFASKGAKATASVVSTVGAGAKKAYGKWSDLDPTTKRRIIAGVAIAAGAAAIAATAESGYRSRKGLEVNELSNIIEGVTVRTIGKKGTDFTGAAETLTKAYNNVELHINKPAVNSIELTDDIGAVVRSSIPFVIGVNPEVGPTAKRDFGTDLNIAAFRAIEKLSGDYITGGVYRPSQKEMVAKYVKGDLKSSEHFITHELVHAATRAQVINVLNKKPASLLSLEGLTEYITEQLTGVRISSAYDNETAFYRRHIPSLSKTRKIPSLLDTALDELNKIALEITEQEIFDITICKYILRGYQNEWLMEEFYRILQEQELINESDQPTD